MRKILVVEDEDAIREVVALNRRAIGPLMWRITKGCALERTGTPVVA